MKTAVIHIGTEKTGSTFLQQALAASRQGLASAGFHYPDFLGMANNHIELTAAFAKPPSGLHGQLGIATPQQQQDLRVQLDQQFGALPQGTWVFSNEHLSSRLVTADLVGEFLAFMATHFDDLRIVAFVRRQDFMVPSAQSTYVKDGGSASLTDRPLPRTYLDHYGLARRWRDGLRPGDSIAFLPYLESFQSSPPEIARRFERAAGLPENVLALPPRGGSNVRLSVIALETMRRLNRRVFAGEESLAFDAPLGAVFGALDSMLGGPDWDISQQQSESLREMWSERNEMLRAMFPEQEWDAWLTQDHEGLNDAVLEQADSSGAAVDAVLDLFENGSVRVKWEGATAEELRHRMQEMEASRSWRLTAPLRRMTDAARRLQRRAERARGTPGGR